MLLDAGAAIDACECILGHSRIREFFQQKGDRIWKTLNPQVTILQLSALHVAMFEGRVAMLRLLIVRGASLQLRVFPRESLLQVSNVCVWVCFKLRIHNSLLVLFLEWSADGATVLLYSSGIGVKTKANCVDAHTTTYSCSKW